MAATSSEVAPMPSPAAIDSKAVAVAALPPRPKFEALKAHEITDGKPQFRKVAVPAHRFSPLKKNWMEIYTPVYEHMKIDIRMNLKVSLL